jgi:hypothetical protein
MLRHYAMCAAHAAAPLDVHCRSSCFLRKAGKAPCLRYSHLVWGLPTCPALHFQRHSKGVASWLLDLPPYALHRGTARAASPLVAATVVHGSRCIGLRLSNAVLEQPSPPVGACAVTFSGILPAAALAAAAASIPAVFAPSSPVPSAAVSASTPAGRMVMRTILAVLRGVGCSQMSVCMVCGGVSACFWACVGCVGVGVGVWVCVGCVGVWCLV